MNRFDFSGFDFFGNNSNNTSKKRADKQRRGRQCRIEELEGREMLSVSPWTLANDHIALLPETVQTEIPPVNEDTLQQLSATSAGTLEYEVLDVTTSSVKIKLTLDLADGVVMEGNNRNFYLLRWDEPTHLQDQWHVEPNGDFWLDVNRLDGEGWNGLDSAVVELTFSNLDSATEYTIFYTFDKDGYETLGAPLTVTTLAKPGALAAPAVSIKDMGVIPAGDDSWVQIEWNAVPDAVGYELHIRKVMAPTDLWNNFTDDGNPDENFPITFTWNGTQWVSDYTWNGRTLELVENGGMFSVRFGERLGEPGGPDDTCSIHVAQRHEFKVVALAADPSNNSPASRAAIKGAQLVEPGSFINRRGWFGEVKDTEISAAPSGAGRITVTYSNYIDWANNDSPYSAAIPTAGVVTSRVQIARDAGFTDIIETQDNDQDTWSATFSDLMEGTYYVRAMYVAEVGSGFFDSVWSPVQTVTVSGLDVPPHILPENIKGDAYVSMVTFVASAAGSTTLYSIDENLHIGEGRTYADIAAARAALEADQSAAGWVAETTATKAGTNQYEFAYTLPSPVGWVPDPHTVIHFVSVTKDGSGTTLSATNDLRISPVIDQNESFLTVTDNGDGTVTIDWRDTDHAAMYTPIAEIIPQYKDASGEWRNCEIIETTLNNGYVPEREGHDLRPDSMPISVKVTAPGYDGRDTIEMRVVTYVRPVTWDSGHRPADEGEWGRADWNVMFGELSLPAFPGEVAARQTFYPQEFELTFDVAAGKYYQMTVSELELSDAATGTIQKTGDNPQAYDNWYKVRGEESIWTIYAGADGNLRLNDNAGSIVGTHADGKATWLFDDVDLYYTPYGFTFAEVDANGEFVSSKSTYAVGWTRLEPFQQVGPMVESASTPGAYDVTLKLPQSLLDMIDSGEAVFLTGNVGGTVPTVLSLRCFADGIDPTIGYQFGSTEVDGLLGADFSNVPMNTPADGAELGLDLKLSFDKASGTYTVTGLKAGVIYEFFYRIEFPGMTDVHFGCAGMNGTLQGNGRIFSALVPVSATAATQLTAPVISAGTATLNTISLSWAAVPGAAGYMVQYRTGGGAWQTWDNNFAGTTAVVDNLAGLVEYEFRVKALATSPDIDSVFSNIVSKATVAAPETQLPSPTVTVGAVTSSSVVLSWTAVTGATGYAVAYSTDGETWSSPVNVTGLTRTVTGLASETAYQFRVQALAADVADNSEWAVVSQETAPGLTPPGFSAPPNFGLDATGAGKTSMGFQWDAVPGAAGYEIRYSSDGGKSWTVVDAGNGTEYTVSNLASGTNYMFQARAVVKTEGKTVAASEWTTGTPAGAEKTTGAASSADKKSKPAKVKAGNGKTTSKSTIDTIYLELPPLANQKQAGAVGYVIEIDITKLPKKWNGVTLTDADKAALVANAEIRISGSVATISGLPAGLKVPFIVKTVDADGQLSAPLAVSATTAKYAATKIKGMKLADAPTLSTITLQPTAPKVQQDAAFAVSYEIVVSYVAKVGSVKTTFYSTFTIAKKNGEVDFTEVPGTAGTNTGGFKGATAPLPTGVQVAINAAAGNIKFSGLPFAGTKYTFAMKTVAEDVYGNKNFSAVGKASVSTAKYNAVKMAKPAGNSLSWTDPKAAAETTHYLVYTSTDKKGAVVEAGNILAVNPKSTLNATVGTTGTVFVAAVVLKDGVGITDFNVVKTNILFQSAAAKVTVK